MNIEKIREEAVTEFMQRVLRKRVVAYYKDFDCPDEITGLEEDMVHVDDIQDTFEEMFGK